MDTLNQVAAQLGIDNSFFWLFGLMFILYLLLKGVYLNPFQALLHERRAKISGTKKEAEELAVQAEEKINQYKIRLKEVTDKARHSLKENEAIAKKEEARLFGEAGAKAKTVLQNAQKELESQKKEAVVALSSEISGLAGTIASKVLGRPI